MPTYRVRWDIDVEADSHEEAARYALSIQRDPTSTATVFQVMPQENGLLFTKDTCKTLDLTSMDEAP